MIVELLLFSSIAWILKASTLNRILLYIQRIFSVVNKWCGHCNLYLCVHMSQSNFKQYCLLKQNENIIQSDSSSFLCVGVSNKKKLYIEIQVQHLKVYVDIEILH